MSNLALFAPSRETSYPKNMKQALLFILILLGASAVFAQKHAAPKRNARIKASKIIAREKFDPRRIAADDLQNAIAKATAENRRIILDVGGEWCGWCRHMDVFIEKNASLKKIKTANFVWLKINYSEENENKEFLAKYPEISGFPHLFVLEKDGTLVKSQDTSALEQGETYNLQKFTDFLKENVQGGNN